MKLIAPLYVKPFIKRQKDDATNTLRSHLYEFGHVAPEGIGCIDHSQSVLFPNR